MYNCYSTLCCWCSNPTSSTPDTLKKPYLESLTSVCLLKNSPKRLNFVPPSPFFFHVLFPPPLSFCLSHTLDLTLDLSSLLSPSISLFLPLLSCDVMTSDRHHSRDRGIDGGGIRPVCVCVYVGGAYTLMPSIYPAGLHLAPLSIQFIV